MIKKAEFVKLIREGDFQSLFISELGWNRFRGSSILPTIVVDDKEYTMTTIAERNGFQVLVCNVDEMPTQSIAKKIDSKLRRQAADYICIYILPGEGNHLWVVPVRANEKRDLVLVGYENSKADFLFSKIEGFSFDFDEETNIVDLRAKVQGAFAVNSEKITKDFYSGFKKEHKAFANFITGIDDDYNRQWYTSVMLNRLMFCYFIQKKGFLNLDPNYLRTKLNWVRQEQGNGKFFQSFYRGFLTELFQDGLDSPKHDRAFEQKYGKIPYLNGGMFDKHQIEREFENIDIDDEAFIRLFDFFDTWQWHLDTRISASGKDINPDVLGYIFEQYINDRAQMGAYYTKEDITEYIGRNCILPFLFDKVADTSSSKDFKTDGYVWETLRNSGDRYVFDAVKRGYSQFDSIPDDISRGIITDDMHEEYCVTPVGQHTARHTPLAELRSEWNRPTPEPWALPTEIWRETIDRLQRCDSILAKIRNGEITSINDFITYNLDIRTFALDLIEHGDSKFVKHFYNALTHVTVLDPTCGSGAFLFAAMNILEPLYEACIERMQAFHAENSAYFRAELEEINGKYRSNIQYFIFKSIILRNLYGVDIMVEATEIAKLRLFLKMVAVVEVDRRADNLGLDPLPDIDFNIRCGNTLVGYANRSELERDLSLSSDILQEIANQDFRKKINIELKKVAETYDTYVSVQLRQEEDMHVFKQAKQELRIRLNTLNDTLNHRQHQASNPHMQYDTWLTSHQPFNWLSEFYGIIEGNGGFDVIIGNPPYVEYTKKNVHYNIEKYETIKASNLYAFVFERSFKIGREVIGLIVQLSALGTDSMKPLQKFLIDNSGKIHYSCFPERPQQLFEGACIALSIFICNKKGEGELYGGGVYRVSEGSRSNLFKLVLKTPISKNDFLKDFYLFPKFKCLIESSIFSKVQRNSSINRYIGTDLNNSLSYRTAGGRYWKIVLNRPFKNNSTSNKTKLLNKNISSSELVAVLNTNLFWWYYVNFFDLYNFKDYMIFNFMYSTKTESSAHLNQLGNRLMQSYERHKEEKNQFIKSKQELSIFESFNPALSKPIIDEIDTELAKHYGFSEEELDFIINYDIKYRMGDELNNND